MVNNGNEIKNIPNFQYEYKCLSDAYPDTYSRYGLKPVTATYLVVAGWRDILPTDVQLSAFMRSIFEAPWEEEDSEYNTWRLLPFHLLLCAAAMHDNVRALQALLKVPLIGNLLLASILVICKVTIGRYDTTETISNIL